jgi:hypothetical protein
LGSALISFSGTSDFTLTATVGTLQTNRLLQDLTGTPVSTIGGTLPGSTTFWSGVMRITNDIVVPAGHTLTIGSNTLVLLDPGSVDIFVNGSIQSLGTELAPITFTCASNNLRWGQIRFTNAAPSLFRHTSVTRGGTGPAEGHTATCPVFRPLNSKLVFESCSIADHAEVRRGAAGFGTPGKAMYAIGSNLSFDDCLLQRCRMGPEIEGTALILTNSYILDMFGPDDADGIYLHTGNSMSIDRCVIAYGDDDGIDTLGANVSVANTIIRNWSNLGEDAKGISIFSGEARIRRCLIVDSTVSIAAKTTPGDSARVSINDSTITGISNSVVAAFKSNATGPVIDIRITNCIMRCLDAVKSDFGPTNFTIRYCNISETWPGEGNDSADPLWVDAAAHDFHLRPFSPCIDAGSPLSPLDPDGSPGDKGYNIFIPPAPQLASPSKSSPFQFDLAAYTNRNYVVEYSTNLVTWDRLQTIFQSQDNTPVQDAGSATDSLRVYRAHLAP